MKNLLVTLSLLIFSSTFAQFSVTKTDGTPILNGDMITYTVATDPQSSLGFHVINNTSSPLLTKILFVSATNYNGTNFQLCYGTECIDNIVVGQSYPNPAFEIPANGQNGNYDHFLNTNTGDGVNYPMDFLFKFYAVDATGAEIGTPIFFTYRYNPSLATTNFTNLSEMGVELNNTVVENNLELTTVKNITIDLFDLNGKKVYSQLVNSGNQNIDLSSLASNIYFLNITNEENQKESIKIIKK
ncbi:T9SS type A sorting domain-containing protein [uncultured Flavobacterium sp.]|uniref:T9SS type A sorting domain-containing protein n=1 Tax=uncultured Flavobacterium sp. TaxID=165435 RepID=UPI0030C8301B